jgi:ATP phosphoribosyltransferase
LQQNTSLLRLAVQKSGRLTEDTLLLLEQCGIQLQKNTKHGALRMPSPNFPIEILLLRDDDIPDYVQSGVANAGIIGNNVLQEFQADNTWNIFPLDYGRCRLSIAIAREMEYTDIYWLDNKRIATSYPNILGKYLKDKEINSEIHILGGSVEIAPGLGLSDAICDIVSSGSTLLANGLKEVECIMESQAVLCSLPNNPPQIQWLLEQLEYRIQSVLRARGMKYLLLNAPAESLDQINQLLPFSTSPTIMPLARKDWCAVHTIVPGNTDFWQLTHALQKAGAQGIVLLPIEQSFG